MKSRPRNRNRQKQVNILHTTVGKRHAEKRLGQFVVLGGLALVAIIALFIGLRLGIRVVLDQILYTNPHYALNEIDIQPKGHFSERLIRQAAGLEPGQNLWSLDLPQITRNLEKLPYVSSAKVERHFPGKLTVLVHERVPVVKIVGLNVDLDTRETFYLDRDGVVLKPRDDEPAQQLPEIIGLTDAELEPGAKLDRPSLACALQILDAIDHTPLHTSIDIRTISLVNPLSITMVTTRDMSIVFRTDCIDQQLNRLQQIVYLPALQQRSIHSIDLTPSINVPITFYQ